MERARQRIVQGHEAEDTRDRILESSCKLFAEQGYDLTSVRDITTDAGCNVASVNYYFGGKENLYLEAFRSMVASLREQRLLVLDELLVRRPRPTLEEFLRSFAEGFIDPLTDDSSGRPFMTFVSREMCDARLPHDVFLHEFIHPILERAMTALERFGPVLDPQTARLCIMSMVGQLLHVLRAHHLFCDRDSALGIPDHLMDYIPHFVRFAAGGIRACAAEETAASQAAAGAEAGP